MYIIVYLLGSGWWHGDNHCTVIVRHDMGHGDGYRNPKPPQDSNLRPHPTSNWFHFQPLVAVNQWTISTSINQLFLRVPAYIFSGTSTCGTLNLDLDPSPRLPKHRYNLPGEFLHQKLSSMDSPKVPDSDTNMVHRDTGVALGWPFLCSSTAHSSATPRAWSRSGKRPQAPGKWRPQGLRITLLTELNWMMRTFTGKPLWLIIIAGKKWEWVPVDSLSKQLFNPLTSRWFCFLRVSWLRVLQALSLSLSLSAKSSPENLLKSRIGNTANSREPTRICINP